MHGYQIMQAMSDRTGGAWHPSPWGDLSDDRATRG
jgi:hypothetical protein